MSNQMNLDAEERVVIGKQLSQLRQDGFTPANVYGRNLASEALQVDSVLLEKLLARGGNKVIQLNVGSQPAVQVLIKQVQRHPFNGKAIHIDFYRLAASEKFKASVQLHFVNTPELASSGYAMVSRSLSEVMVECFPADLPTNISVDLSRLREIGDVIRVSDLAVNPGVAILTHHNDPVAGLYLQARVAEAAGNIVKDESNVATPDQ